MADKSQDPGSRDSFLYEEFLAEREEILRQKWLKSEEAGCDVGLERVLTEWAQEARGAWKRDFLKRQRNQPG